MAADITVGQVWVARTGDATFTVRFVYTTWVAGEMNDGTPRAITKDHLQRQFSLEPAEVKQVRALFVNVYRQGVTIPNNLRMRFFLTADAATQFASANGLLGDRVAVARFGYEGAVA